MEPLSSLTPAQHARVLDLCAAAEAADTVAPLNEEARLQLGRPDALHWVARDGDTVVGYAQWQPANATGQLVVHPDHRRSGHGTSLFAALLADVPEPAVWAFGDLHGAQRFAASAGMVPGRGLHIMERELTDAVPREVPEGVRLRPFTDADADAFLAVNAAAFADHPEQGHFSAADLANRQAEAWWDPAGLILAEDAEGVVGFHWTKRHDDVTGEVYVLGVHPRAGGRGLGGVLLDAGLAHLAAGGNSRVILYVDAGNAPAVALYERSGFRVVHTDTLYRPAAG
ncbi:mycothiol synthase [Propioniciclava sp. MC1595]|uniref:mycothiol synthase n=1 Tax=Propioniciclava sp. MC1595 TaxID=2760308 RepID=UPI0016624012|nr:mycothiol synthase [Propioniciclava sp. MC1595]MBB1494989.1 mycothiol synthase [Propioniciclava sp. MC1595]QTE25606.1 mycothiol synthase [Propioniciclava sp. MC1595]